MTVTIWRRSRSGLQVAGAHRARVVVVLAATGLLVSIAAVSVLVSLALFTARVDGDSLFGTKVVFPGERVTPAFIVTDSSSGSAVDRSSPFAFSGDGLTTTTSAWSTAYAAGRYVEVDLNHPLASGIAVGSASFDLRFASSGAGQACYYFEVRRVSSGAVLATYGSSTSAVGCVTGTTPASFSTPIASVATTDVANDLRIRIFGKESLNGSMVIDRATVTGSNPYQSFTLYPVMFRDAADTTPDLIPWGLDVP